jgi:3-oxoadipate enol-lactonase
MPIFQSDRGRLHYEELGAGRPVLLIHGFTNYGLAWAPQLAALVHAGYRVILPDLHGHGASAPATSLCTVADLAADMVALLDHLAIGCAALCGLSLGGMIALQLTIERPDRVAAAVVANSRSSFVGPEMRAIVDGWTAMLLQEDGSRKRLRATWPMLVNEPFRNSPTGNAVFEAWGRVLEHVPGSSLCHVARGMNRFDLRRGLGGVRAPVLVISGEHDRLFNPDHGRDISSEIAGSKFVVISGAGHLSNLDSPDQFNRLLLAFLTYHSPA